MNKTQGHVGSTGGLRGHSIGGTYPWMPVGFGDDTWQCQNLVTGEYEARRYKSVADCLDACVDIWEAEMRGVLPVPPAPVVSPNSPGVTCGGYLAPPRGETAAELDRKMAAAALAIATEQGFAEPEICPGCLPA